MNPGEVGERLRRTNRWWRTPVGWEGDDPDLRRVAQAPFRYTPNVLAGVAPDGLYLLRGPRRVGKSVEVKRSISGLIASGIAPRRIIHASVDGWQANDLGHLLPVGREQLTRGVDEPRWWFIDEVTAVRGDWPETVKWLRDNTAMGEDCVVLTGSSTRNIDAAVKALAGRRGRHTIHSDRMLLPMGFRDFCSCVGMDIPLPDRVDARDLLTPRAAEALETLMPWQDDAVNAWEAYLAVGGFPQAVTDYLETGSVGDAFNEAIWHIVYGDAIRSEALSSVQTQALLAGLAHRLGSTVVVTGLAEEIGAGRDAVAARLEDLHAAFLTWPHHLDDGHGRPDLRAQHKEYFLDPLVARLAARRNPETLAAPSLAALSEQQLGVALLRAAERAEPGAFPRFDRVLFARTPSRKEIDFVPGAYPTEPIESKYSDGPWRRSAQTLQAARGRGVMATRNVLELDHTPMWAVPAALVALLID